MVELSLGLIPGTVRPGLRFLAMSLERPHTRLGMVVVADDHEVTRFGLTQLLKTELGAEQVVSVGDFDSAMAHLRKGGVALVVLDLGMPGLDGPQALAEVRRTCPKAKVVVLSASSHRDDILGCLAAGVHGCLVKTEGMETLIERLWQILRGTIYVPSELAELSFSEQRPSLQSSVPSLVSTLTERQKSILQCLERGLSNKEIGRELSISDRTVKMHLIAIYRLLGARNRTQAVMMLRDAAQGEKT